MDNDFLEKLLKEVESYAEYNLKIKDVLQSHLEKCIDESSKLHYEKQISLLIGRSMGLYMSAMTIRKKLNLEIPKNGNYQICFEDVFK